MKHLFCFLSFIVLMVACPNAWAKKNPLSVLRTAIKKPAVSIPSKVPLLPGEISFWNGGIPASLPRINPVLKEEEILRELKEKALSTDIRAQQKLQKAAAFDALSLRTTVNLQNPILEAYGSFFSATAFFIEETYEGQKATWIVTAAHIIDDLGESNLFIRLFMDDKFPVEIPVSVVAVGTAGMGDVALLKAEEELPSSIRPIPLAKTVPQIGEALRSYGFFDNGYHIVRNRRVLVSTPGRIITSFEFGNLNRDGACGGPVINEHNELVGIHCGSSAFKKESYVVPVSFLNDLLEAVHNHGIKERNLVVNGKIIGKININEYIHSIKLKRSGTHLRTFLPWRKEVEVDYNHLENLLPLEKADEIEISLFKNPSIKPAESSSGIQGRTIVLKKINGCWINKPQNYFQRLKNFFGNI